MYPVERSPVGDGSEAGRPSRPRRTGRLSGDRAAFDESPGTAVQADLDDVEAVACAAVLAGGEVLRERYREGDHDGDDGAHDVKAAADEAAEARMLPVVRRAFPEHAVFAEEAGEFPGSEPSRPIIDPLDGTNDFTAGLATFASSVAVREDGDPTLAAIHLPVAGETYVARRGAGVRYDGERVAADSDLPVEAATVATIVGRTVPREADLARRAEAIREGLDGAVKRVLDSLAPTVHSGLFSRGPIQGLVQFHHDEEERAVTDPFAAEAGAAVEREGPLSVAAVDGATRRRLRAAIRR